MVDLGLWQRKFNGDPNIIIGVLPPEFRSRHTYLEIDENTGRDEMKDNLDVPRVLGLILPAEQQRRLEAKKQFGRTTFYTELRYGNDAGAVRRAVTRHNAL